jgi:hypothetical protein
VAIGLLTTGEGLHRERGMIPLGWSLSLAASGDACMCTRACCSWSACNDARHLVLPALCFWM